MVRVFKSAVIAAMVCLSLASMATFLRGTANLRVVASNGSAETSKYQPAALASATTDFDSAVGLARNLIESSLPGKEAIPKVFDPLVWDKKTQGGLRQLDRAYLSKIYGAAESVFEYGLGESTYIADFVGVQRYAGIDSDAAWVALVRGNVADHFRFYFADIGPTIEWGYPKTDGLAKRILNYQLMPLIVEPQPFDVYMVDGRWRLPSMIVSFLHASARGADHNKTVVLLHDCIVKEMWDTNSTLRLDEGLIRSIYRSADHLLDIVDHSGTFLCVFKRRPETTDSQLLKFWEQNYQLID